ncbi:BgTH12-02475 [Blumeria graminis f. sp. triticale]|nr:BgTH12-02475 [Blumeria graminis f. sp. triticale]
MLLIYM